MLKKLMSASALAILVVSLSACEAKKTQEGEMPQVDVDVSTTGGQVPKYDVDAADVDVNTSTATVTVPDVDVTTETGTVTVPDVDVTMPSDKKPAGDGGGQ